MNDYHDYLAHYGVLGMHWGIRRYQPYSTTGARKGGKTGKEIGEARSAGKQIRRSNREAVKTAKAEKKAEEEKAKYEAEKQQALRSGKVSEVEKYKDDLTDQELQAAVNRIRTDQTLAELKTKEMDLGKQKLDQIKGALNSVKSTADAVIGAYNTAAKIHNAFSENSEWRTIGDKSLAQTLKDKAKAQEEAAAKKRDSEIDEVIRRGDRDEIIENLSRMDSKQAASAKLKLDSSDKIRDGRNSTTESSSKSDNGRNSTTESSSKSDNGSSSSNRKYYATSDGRIFTADSDGTAYEVKLGKGERATSASGRIFDSSGEVKYSTPNNAYASRSSSRDNSPKVTSFVGKEYVTKSGMHESNAVVNRLASDVVERGKSSFNRYWGFS